MSDQRVDSIMIELRLNISRWSSITPSLWACFLGRLQSSVASHKAWVSSQVLSQGGWIYSHLESFNSWLVNLLAYYFVNDAFYIKITNQQEF